MFDSEFPRSLYNPLAVSPRVRLCYWHVDYVPPAPFCLSSKLTNEENRILLDFEEVKDFERFDSIKFAADACIQRGNRVEYREADNFIYDEQERFFDAKKVVNSWVSLLSENDKKEFGLYNIQTSDGVPPINGKKLLINRSDFLTR